MTSKQTHYRTFSKSKHLSSEDLLGMEYLRVTIESVVTGKDENKRIKEPVPVARFKEKQIRQGEPLKTMILNMTNMKTIEDITGSPYLEDWANTEIEIYVASNIRLGNDLVDGLRLRRPPAPTPKPPLTEKVLEQVISTIQDAESLDKLELIKTRINSYQLTDPQPIRINNAYNKRKEELSKDA